MKNKRGSLRRCGVSSVRLSGSSQHDPPAQPDRLVVHRGLQWIHHNHPVLEVSLGAIFRVSFASPIALVWGNVMTCPADCRLGYSKAVLVDSGSNIFTAISDKDGKKVLLSEMAFMDGTVSGLSYKSSSSNAFSVKAMEAKGDLVFLSLESLQRLTVFNRTSRVFSGTVLRMTRNRLPMGRLCRFYQSYSNQKQLCDVRRGFGWVHQRVLGEELGKSQFLYAC